MGRPSRSLAIVLNLLLIFAPGVGFTGALGSFTVAWIVVLLMMLVAALAPALTILYLHRHVSRQRLGGFLRPILITANAVTLLLFLVTGIASALAGAWKEPPGAFFMIEYMILPITNILAVAVLKRRPQSDYQNSAI